MADETKRPSPVAQAIAALGVCVVIIVATFQAPGCSGQQLAPLVRCKVDAVTRVVPEDPNQLTIGDLLDVIGRLRECREAAARGDAGK